MMTIETMAAEKQTHRRRSQTPPGTKSNLGKALQKAMDNIPQCVNPICTTHWMYYGGMNPATRAGLGYRTSGIDGLWYRFGNYSGE